MAVLLAFFLLLAIAGLAFLGYYAFQLYLRTVHLDADLIAQQTQHDSDKKHWNELAASAKTQHQELVGRFNEEARKWNEQSVALKTENQRLSKWRNVADADAKAAELIRTAQAALEQAKTDANNLIDLAHQRSATELATAKETASTLTSEARDKAKAQKDEAQAILNSATTQAARITEAANKKAMEVGGSAYEAMKNAAIYEQAIRAMKNIIEGYGDRYMISEQSLLDDLAEDFGHTQAGHELKRARECTKVMIQNGTSAVCEYAEANRRETAVNFVVDAFNGKVDSIFSRSKADNSGKLEQEVRDAFALVNYHGKAFRDARITDAYLAARLDELKWATVAQQLAFREREEQRHIKELAREEARTAKEHERALREAAKDEETLRKGIEQGRQQLEQASGEQKAMYEHRLQEMIERLRQAEERKQRAMSMAQQTKNGHVYIISNPGSLGEDVYKIGLTRRWDPLDRIHELGGASVPFGFDVHAMILSDNAPALEHLLHKHFLLMQMNKVNHRKEFFKVSLKEIHEQIENLGLTGVKWTMTAEAKEYRESLAIEKSIKDDPAKREAWIKRQSRMELGAYDDLEPAGVLDEDE